MISRRSALAALASITFVLSGILALAQASKLKAIASFSILGNLVHQVGGDRVEVMTLVGPNGDAHVFPPPTAYATKVANAKIIFVNGLGFDDWINCLVKSSGSTASLVIASTNVKAINGEEEHDHSKSEHSDAGHDHGNLDPHAWQDVANAKIYVANIRDGLIRADPAGKGAYENNAKSYLTKLDMLEAEVKARVAKIPPERRKILTSHNAFRYFEHAYGIDFVAPQGVSTEGEASAADVAKIVKQIKTEHITAAFVENISDPRLIEQISRESGARICGPLFSDVLSDQSGPASTYIDMIRNNVNASQGALSS
ncbi:metal ABC transporter solute-binding protein, Zn/Mn family [Microvirga calopogonii]|uniref:metal ABC transporter solute-binding protein, Zn/Mn family n=1 Tax=Microvirga calopogonii TaxID=2078013 RepID=UPI000E0D3D3F|nr:zinc ABC transporter substrate-binding protein [Microvirga calopogonii]